MSPVKVGESALAAAAAAALDCRSFVVSSSCIEPPKQSARLSRTSGATLSLETRGSQLKKTLLGSSFVGEKGRREGKIAASSLGSLTTASASLYSLPTVCVCGYALQEVRPQLLQHQPLDCTCRVCCPAAVDESRSPAGKSALLSASGEVFLLSVCLSVPSCLRRRKRSSYSYIRMPPVLPSAQSVSSVGAVTREASLS